MARNKEIVFEIHSRSFLMELCYLFAHNKMYHMAFQQVLRVFKGKIWVLAAG
jgi:hypothetical protein